MVWRSKTVWALGILSILLMLFPFDVSSWFAFPPSYTEEEVGFEEEIPMVEIFVGANGKYRLADLEHWERPSGFPRVGIQVGHWKNDEVPEELAGLRDNGAGAVGGGTTERATVLAIAERTKKFLEQEGITVDLLPTTVPPGYLADAFVSIHADGNGDPTMSGFKIASPRRDFGGDSPTLEEFMYTSYGDVTKLPRDSNITRRMRGYYAFNWYRYEHAIHPMTPAVIVETGFMTSPSDRAIIVKNPELAGRGIANGVLEFLRYKHLYQ